MKALDLLHGALPSALTELSELPFVVVEADPPRFRILPGEWTLERTLVVPAGRVLIMGPGTKLSPGEPTGSSSNGKFAEWTFT